MHQTGRDSVQALLASKINAYLQSSSADSNGSQGQLNLTSIHGSYRHSSQTASKIAFAPHEACIQFTLADADPSTPVTVTVPGLPPAPRAVMLHFAFPPFHFMAP